MVCACRCEQTEHNRDDDHALHISRQEDVSSSADFIRDFGITRDMYSLSFSRYIYFPSRVRVIQTFYIAHNDLIYMYVYLTIPFLTHM